MIRPTKPPNEEKRLEALKEYSILDTLPEKEYDEITFLASQICKTPISLISLVDNKRQWFKSHYGLDVNHTPREVAFCAHAINKPKEILIVPDSRKDERFHDNPLVTDHPKVIFYVGIPLLTTKGYPLGTLCIIDNKPNELSATQIQSLQALSNQLMRLLEFRKTAIELQVNIFELEAQNQALTRFANMAAHDIKSPLNSIVMFVDLLKQESTKNMSTKAAKLVDVIGKSALRMGGLIDGILRYSKNSKLLSTNRTDVDVSKTVYDIIVLLQREKEINFKLEIPDNLYVFTNKVAIERIFINLLTNSIKYNDKPQAQIAINIDREPKHLVVSISDNGPGIRQSDKERIFKIFETTANVDSSGYHGSGIGLATVKSLVEGLGGTIRVESELGKGATFSFTLAQENQA